MVENKKILVVEDERIIADDIVRTLDSLGYSVVGTASSGEEAIRKAAELKPDIVLMDIILKGSIDGIKAAHHVRNTFKIPVVFLTSHSDDSTFRRAKESGPFGYIIKPFESHELHATVEMALYNYRIEKTLKESAEWFSITLMSIADAIIVIRHDGTVEFMNPAAENITGWKFEEALNRPIDKIFRCIDEAGHAPVPNPLQAVRAGDHAVERLENILLIARDGREIPIERNSSAVKAKEGGMGGVVVIFHDITDRRAADRAIMESEKFLNTTFESIQDPFCIISRDMRIIRVNRAYADYKNKKASDLIGKVCYEEIWEEHACCDDCVVAKTLESGDPFVKEKHVAGADGNDVWYEISTHPIVDEAGVVTHVIEYTRDITERKRLEQERVRLIKKLEYMSKTDVLTHLNNRGALIERLEFEVDRCKRYGSKLTLALCDIDRFKEINDTWGHSEGDRALCFVSEIFKAESRGSDIVGRYGGDEFMLIFSETITETGREIAERVRARIVQSNFVTASGEPLSLTISIGLSCYHTGEEDYNPVIKRADDALYISKREGRNRVSVVE